MPVLKQLDDTHFVLIPDVEPEIEEEFVNSNPGYIRVESLPEAVFGFYIYNSNTNTFEVDTEKEIPMYKRLLIERMDAFTKEYIVDRYPYEKQLADAQQQDFYGTAIMMIRQAHSDRDPLTIDQIYVIIGDLTNQVWYSDNPKDTFISLVSQFPEDERYYWSQLLKCSIRKAWVVRGCVYPFNQYRQSVLNASTLDELKALDVEAIDFLEFPYWLDEIVIL